MADIQSEAFKKIGYAEAEVDIVDYACAEGSDCVVEETEGDFHLLFFGTESESLLASQLIVHFRNG